MDKLNLEVIFKLIKDVKLNHILLMLMVLGMQTFSLNNGFFALVKQACTKFDSEDLLMLLQNANEAFS